MPVITLVMFAPFLYLIIALQVANGFPALYEKFPGRIEDDIRLLLPYIFSLMLIMVTATVVKEVLFLFGIVSAWAGWRVRKSVQVRTDGPLRWLLHPLTSKAFNKWPMLAFDIWTLGIVTLFGVIILSNS